MQNKARIGVLFCGGCNCYYDRETFYKKIQKELSDECEFLYYKENEHYNLVMMVNGCQSECLLEHEYGSPTVSYTHLDVYKRQVQDLHRQ